MKVLYEHSSKEPSKAQQPWQIGGSIAISEHSCDEFKIINDVSCRYLFPAEEYPLQMDLWKW